MAITKVVSSKLEDEYVKEIKLLLVSNDWTKRDFFVEALKEFE